MTDDFETLAQFASVLERAPHPDETAYESALARNLDLTKPPAALGRLEDLASWYCGWRGDPRAEIRAPQVIVFAGNHGVAARGVSAFPPEVTAQMVDNFRSGGAAINQLAECAGARMDVHALSLEAPTADFTRAPAMTENEVVTALRRGWEAVDPATDLLVAGEMGIGNTTSAAAISCALFGGLAADWTGQGTGIDVDGLAGKTRVVADGVVRHANAGGQGLEVLRRLGGRELAAIAGAVARARALRIPVILDGFICCAAAACLERARKGALDHAIAGHVSAESGHAPLLRALGMVPLLSLGMRLGEGSGAALAIPVLRGALACHSRMATFTEAGVSGR